MSIEVHLGKSISERRRYLGLSQEQLGAKAGIHRAYVSDVERGIRNITLAVFERIAEALQTPMATLMHDAEARAASETHLRSMGTRRRDLVVLVEQLADQLSQLTQQTEDLKMLSKGSLDRAKNGAKQLRDKTGKQIEQAEENQLRSDALDEQERQLMSRETHMGHREKFLDSRINAPQKQRKKKK